MAAALRPPKHAPLVAVVSDRKELGDLAYHTVGEKYFTALIEAAGVFPVAVPVPPFEMNLSPLLERIDGIFLPGSPSNVAPARYDGAAPRAGVLQDPDRDRTAFPLIAAALERDIPLLAFCRGFQELNVAMGGTLHQHITEVPALEGFEPRFAHPEPKDAPVEERYGLRHRVTLTPGGYLAGLLGEKTLEVNSLHNQAVDRLGQGLAVEATAPDGLIEAIRVPEARFALGVQWHPDWRPLETWHYARILEAFGAACSD